MAIMFLHIGGGGGIPPSDGAKLDRIRLSSDPLSKGLGFGAVEQADLLRMLGGFNNGGGHGQRHRGGRRDDWNRVDFGEVAVDGSPIRGVLRFTSDPEFLQRWWVRN